MPETPESADEQTPPAPQPLEPRPASFLKAERSLVEPARLALKKNQPRRALKLVEEHRLLYPNGQLSEERDLIGIRARVLLGQKQRAHDEARRFLDRYPRSLLRPLVEAILNKQR